MKHFCQQASRLSSDALERPLSLKERLQLNLHCWMCQSCRHYRQALNTLQQTLQQIRQQTIEGELGEHAKKRIIAHCQQKEKKP